MIRVIRLVLTRSCNVDHSKLLQDLLQAKTTVEIESILKDLKDEYQERIEFVPVGNEENNVGHIAIGSDPGKGLVERLTNAIDGILELEHYRHDGKPTCNSPLEAAARWLGVHAKGLYMINASKRGELAKLVQLTIEKGDSSNLLNITVADKGIGISRDEMTKTILSLGRSNKVQKPYLIGAYGQGGSSTYAYCDYTVICSLLNSDTRKEYSFTIVFYEDLPPEEYKLGRYVYVTLDGDLFHGRITGDLADYNTIVKHYAYDLTAYKSKLGPASVYGLLQRALFDPVLPIMLDDKIHDNRRTIKGARNAFNAAADEELEERGPSLSYNLPIYNISLCEYGSIGLEYWVLKQSLKKYEPIKAYVDDKRPILFTLNGQTHAEFSGAIIRSDAELPFLRNRLVVHVDCNNLTPLAKRNLFSSTREDIRKNQISKMILEEIVKSLKSDDELRLLNEEAKDITIQRKDEGTERVIQKEVAKLLHFYDFNATVSGGGTKTFEIPKEITTVVPTAGSHTHRLTKKIELHDPPTYLKILNKSPVEFYPEQRHYMRIETDAMSSYHNAEDTRSSKFNIIINGQGLTLSGTTPLNDGRMRIILDCDKNTVIGTEGQVTIELHRYGAPTITDQTNYKIVERPLVKSSKREVSVPNIEPIPVNGLEDDKWDTLGWPHDINQVASSSDMSNGTLLVYYSTVFPPYVQHYQNIVKTRPAVGSNFVKQYEILLSLHSLLLENSRKEMTDLEDVEKWEEQERCRFAILSCISAEQSTKNVVVLPEIE